MGGLQMRLLKLLIALVLGTAMVHAQTIKISGKVTDSSGATPLVGVIVTLEKTGLTATTVADGNFTLTGTIGINTSGNTLQNKTVSAGVFNGVLFLGVREKGIVEVITYSLQGQAVSQIKKVMDIGVYTISHQNGGHGVYIYIV
jgi:hypothetical protein